MSQIFSRFHDEHMAADMRLSTLEPVSSPLNSSSISCTCLNATVSSSCQQPCSTRHFSGLTVTLLQLLYIAILFVGIFGNVLTCSVIAMRRNMRRSIHFYTFNLAVADLLILLVYVPTQMIYIEKQLVWTMGLPMCKIVNVILPVALVALIFTLLAITIDRARGLARPFHWRADSRKSARIALPCIWILACLLSTPLFIYPKLELDSAGLYCSDGLPLKALKVYWTSMFVVWFLLPLVIIIVTHAYMVYVMMKDKASLHRRHNKKMVRMIVMLVTTYTICTGLQHVHFIFTVYFGGVSHLFFAISNLVVSLQAALNPIVYGTLRQDFNMAFKNLAIKLLKKFGILSKDTKLSTRNASVSHSNMHSSNAYSSLDDMFNEIRKATGEFPYSSFSIFGQAASSALMPGIPAKALAVLSNREDVFQEERPSTTSAIVLSEAALRCPVVIECSTKLPFTDSFDSGCSVESEDLPPYDNFASTLADPRSLLVQSTPDAGVRSTIPRERRVWFEQKLTNRMETPWLSNRLSRIFEKLRSSQETNL